MKKMTAMAAMAMMCMSMPAMAAMDKNTPEKMKMKTDYWFNKMDTDHDGKISKEEHDAFGEDMFKKADANGDGSISKEEMMAAKKKEKEEMSMNMDKTPEHQAKQK